MNEEPSVLDYVKSRLMLWRGKSLDIPASSERQFDPGLTSAPPDDQGPGGQTLQQGEAILTPQAAPTRQALIRWPWRSLSALALACIAQWMLEPRPNPDRWQLAFFFYLGAMVFLGFAVWHKEWQLAVTPNAVDHQETLDFHLPTFLVGVVFLSLAFFLFGAPFSDNQFNPLNTFLWLAGAGLAGLSFWQQRIGMDFSAVVGRTAAWIRSPVWSFHISRFGLLWLTVFAVCVFFRFHQLAQVPPEMNSDHAEKLLDVVDVLDGKYAIFFPRNTGREPLQFYLIALTVNLFGTGISFLSMKIGTALAGVAVLPFIYLIGKELANRQAGLLAMAFAGIAYWPNVLSRVALRFSFYPLFAAPALYFFIRGLRSGRNKDFILSGLALGIGLLGYTPIRILPLVLVIAALLAFLHNRVSPQRKQLLYGLVLTAFFAFAASLPLLRYAQDHPEAFAYRAFSRLTDLERALPQPAGMVFLDNLKNAMLMFGWNNGQIWPISIPGRPALDVISAALFYLGMFLLLARYLRQRKWEDLFLFLAVPLLMLPSILSLAYPGENPAPNRAGGAMVPVFVIIGLVLDGLLRAIKQQVGGAQGRLFATLAALVLFLLAASQNHDLVFRQYHQQYALSAWNTTEMGLALNHFAAASGDLDATWVVKSAHWVDTRLVGMHAGDPRRDFGIDWETIPATAADPRPKLFLVRHFLQPEDRAEEEQVLFMLQQTYPEGWAQLFSSHYFGKDFWMFFTPPTKPGIQITEINPGLNP
jgi:hypothetical protein